MASGPRDARVEAARVLSDHWDEARGHTYPNRKTYPHQWLWDSCFAAIAWHAVGEPGRGLRELTGALSGQLPSGFVPHMRYAFPNTERGPRSDVSSFTQPPVFAHAARVLARDEAIPAPLLEQIGTGLDWLWTHRRTPDGLLFLVHPWESGADDSPRWDGWVAPFLGKDDWTRLRWRRRPWSKFDRHLLGAAIFDAEGVAIGSREFVCAPAAFNAIAAHAASEYAALSGDASWGARARDLATAMDTLMWNEETGLWTDVPIVGGGAGPRTSAHVPTLDGVLGALVTTDQEKAARALDQLADRARFAAPYGLAYVARDAPSYNRDAYWRGTAWMQMNYLARLTALRWSRDDLVELIRAMSVNGALASKFAEHWNPETGRGHGAVPLTWSAVVAAM